jgi:hypothetical protein
MTDQKLRCALIYRMEEGGSSSSSSSSVCLAKYDHAAAYETHGGTELYGGRDKSYADAVSAVIENDPPTGLSSDDGSTFGGFKVVQSDQHQVVYGADSDGICT